MALAAPSAPALNSRETVFPPEILYEIIGNVAAEYVDYAIVGSVVEDETRSSEELPSNNAIIPLLETSYQIRDVSLQVLSDMLCIARDDTKGLASNPWTAIRKARKMTIDAYHSDGTHKDFYDAYKSRRAELKSQTPRSPLLYAYNSLTWTMYLIRSGIQALPPSFSNDGYDKLVWKHCDMSMQWSKVKQSVLRERLRSRSLKLLGTFLLTLYFNAKGNDLYGIVRAAYQLERLDESYGGESLFDEEGPLVSSSEEEAEALEWLKDNSENRSLELVHDRRRIWNLTMRHISNTLDALLSVKPDDLLQIEYIEHVIGDFDVEITRDALVQSKILFTVTNLYMYDDQDGGKIKQKLDALLEKWSPVLTEEDRKIPFDDDEESDTEWETDEEGWELISTTRWTFSQAVSCSASGRALICDLSRPRILMYGGRYGYCY